MLNSIDDQGGGGGVGGSKIGNFEPAYFFNALFLQDY